jgi:cation:H+ antiporter
MTLTAFLMAAGGLVLLFVGGEVLLRGAVGLALRLGISPMLIGLTIVAFATSMPELVVTLTAGLEGVPDVGVGNVVGSNIANILLILGVAALISPIATEPRQILRDSSAMILATAVFVVFAMMGTLIPLHGGIMLTLLLLYLWISYRAERAGSGDRQAELAALEEAGNAPCGTLVASVLLVVGIAGLILGSNLLVDGAVDIARGLGVSETVIGLTLVAFGTSLPELATAIVAGIRGHTEVALGNVLGSNIFNILLIIGALAILTPVAVSPEILRFDMWIMVGVTLLVVPVMITGKRIGRWEGAGFVALYAAFILFQFDFGAGPG